MDPQPTLWTKAAESIIASGPMAIVLGVALIVLWKAYQQLLKDFLGFLSGVGDKDKKP